MRQLSQSEWIMGAIVAGFVVFLAVRGKLGNYWSLLVGGGSGAAEKGAAAQAGSAAGGGGLLGTGLGGLLDQWGIGSPSSSSSPSSPSSTGPTVGDVLAGNAVTGTVTQGQDARGAIFSKIPGASSVPIPQVFF